MKNWTQTSWVRFHPSIPYLPIFINKGCQHVHLDFSLSISILSMWFDPIQFIWINTMASNHFLYMIQQWFDPSHNITSSSLISDKTKFKYYLLHHSHGSWCPSHHLSFTFTWSFEALSLVSSPSQAIPSHIMICINIKHTLKSI